MRPFLFLRPINCVDEFHGFRCGGKADFWLFIFSAEMAVTFALGMLSSPGTCNNAAQLSPQTNARRSFLRDLDDRVFFVLAMI